MRPQVAAHVDEVHIELDQVALDGFLTIPEDPQGMVIFAHGSGSSRYSSRNQYVAEVLNDAHLATLLFDLLTPDEHEIDARTRAWRFNIPLLARRTAGAVEWTRAHDSARGLPIGIFGASTGAAAALIAAAELPQHVRAVVSRGGRPDLAGVALPRVQAPTLLIVGGFDMPVIAMNEDAAQAMRAETRLEIIPGASHLFEEPGTLESAARLAQEWFVMHLNAESHVNGR